MLRGLKRLITSNLKHILQMHFVLRMLYYNKVVLILPAKHTVLDIRNHKSPSFISWMTYHHLMSFHNMAIQSTLRILTLFFSNTLPRDTTIYGMRMINTCGCHYKLVQNDTLLHTALYSLKQNSYQSFNAQKLTHILCSQMSCRESFLRIWRKLTVIMGLHCAVSIWCLYKESQ